MSDPVDVRAVADRADLASVFDVVGAMFEPPHDRHDNRFADLDRRFDEDAAMMQVAVSRGRCVGAALAFRTGATAATLRSVAVAPEFRRCGIGRRLVAAVEREAYRLGVRSMSLGTDEAVWFWFRLGYTPMLLLQWGERPDRFEADSARLLDGPLRGVRTWRSSYDGTPQLFALLDEPSPELRREVAAAVTGCHVGFAMHKELAPAGVG